MQEERPAGQGVEGGIRAMLHRRVRRAGITLYASMITGIMLSLIAACLTSARMSAARAQIANSAEVGLFSLFSYYDRQLFEQFDIFGLNCGGNMSAADLASVCRTAGHYMEGVLDQNSQHLKLQHIGITGCRFLTDNGGEPFFRQAVQSVKEGNGDPEILSKLRLLRSRTELFRALEENAEHEEGADWFTRYHAAVEEAERLSREAAEQEEDLLSSGGEDVLDGGEVYSSVDDPVPVVESIYGMGCDVCLAGIPLPAAAEGTGNAHLTERALLQGMDLYDGLSADNSEDSLLWFHYYIQQKMGNLRNPASALPACQMEFILEGTEDDRENLERVVKRIIRLRMGKALETIDGNPGCQAELAELTGRICGIYLVPPDETVIRETLRFCWAYAESICETLSLLSGGTAPVSGNAELLVPLSGLSSLYEFLEQSADTMREGGDQMKYEDYLALFMLREPKDTVLIRTMDCVECSMRQSGREGFYLDHCMADCEISADIRANGRKTFTVTKAFGYD